MNKHKGILNYSFDKMKLGTCLLFSVSLFSCAKFVEIAPPQSRITTDNVFQTDAGAIASLTGIYSKMGNEQPTQIGFTHIGTWILGTYSDEFSLWQGVTNDNQLSYYKNDLSTSNNTGDELWNSAYNYIYSCNSAIEGLSRSQSLSSYVKEQLIGEAKFLRGMFYYYLVTVYGDVPLILNTDYTLNLGVPRANKTEVFKQIFKDLLEAELMLSKDFLDGSLNKVTLERVRPTKHSARALLARISLLMDDWINAEKYSTLVINQTSLFDLVELDKVFLKNSKESIWQIQPTITGYNTQQGRLLIIPSAGPNTINALFLSKSLLEVFEEGDNRKVKWIDSIKVSSNLYHYASKYKIGALDNTVISTSALKEYLSVLRLSELYLIRAEANARLGRFDLSFKDLNRIRDRARKTPTNGMPNPLPPRPETSNLDIAIAYLVKERQIELFSEWGHRWEDIVRLKMVDSIMGKECTLKGGIWNSYKNLFPIPQNERNLNPFLSQNFGY